MNHHGVDVTKIISLELRDKLSLLTTKCLTQGSVVKGTKGILNHITWFDMQQSFLLIQLESL